MKTSERGSGYAPVQAVDIARHGTPYVGAPRSGLSITQLRQILKAAQHCWLDVGCGSDKQEGCVGMDRRAVKGVDVVHDVEHLPWPFEDNSFDRIIMSHVMEHINPSICVDVMNEMWRIMKVGGVLMMAMPYPGSYGHWQDPTHIKPWNEATPRYFDPETPELYRIYQPKPWEIRNSIVWRSDGNIEIGLWKRPENYVPTHMRKESRGNAHKKAGGRRKKGR